MAIDFEQAKEDIKKQKRKESGKNRYHMTDFLYPAKLVTEQAIENAEIKDDTVRVIAEKAADIANKAGLEEDFTLDPEYSEMLMRNERNAISGSMYVSSDRKYSFFVDMNGNEDGSVEFGISLYKYESGNLFLYDENTDKWEPVDIEKEIPKKLPDLFEDAFEEGTLSVTETVKRRFFKLWPDKSEEEWTRFKTENMPVIKLVESMDGVIQTAFVDGNLYAIPVDEFHTGIALGSNEGNFDVWQMFSSYGVLTDEELVDYNVPKAIVYMKRVGRINSMSNAKKFAEAHMDRSTLMGKVMTVPMSSALVFHFTNEPVEDRKKAIELIAQDDKTGRYRKKMDLVMDVIEKIREGLPRED